MAIPVMPYKKGEKYTTDEIVNHVKFLPKGSKERAATINAIAKGGQSEIGRTKIYECLKNAGESTAVAHAETIRRS